MPVFMLATPGASASSVPTVANLPKRMALNWAICPKLKNRLMNSPSPSRILAFGMVVRVTARNFPMANDAKLGLVLGVAIVLVIALVFFRSEPLAAKGPGDPSRATTALQQP